MIFIWIIVAGLVSAGIITDSLLLMSIGFVLAALALAARNFWKPAGVSLVLAGAVFLADGRSFGSLGSFEILVLGSIAGLVAVVIGLMTMFGAGPLKNMGKHSPGGGHES